MALNPSISQCLPMLPGSMHSLSIKLRLTLWSGCPRRPSVRSTWTALSGVSNSPRSGHCQHRSFRSLARPHLLHCSAQPLMASSVTPSMPRNVFQGIRRLHSETSDEGQNGGNKISLWPWSIWSAVVAWAFYQIGRERGIEQGVKELTDQLPEANLFNEREALRKEEETLKHNPKILEGRHHCGKHKVTFLVRHDISRE